MSQIVQFEEHDASWEVFQSRIIQLKKWATDHAPSFLMITENMWQRTATAWFLEGRDAQEFFQYLEQEPSTIPEEQQHEPEPVSIFQ